MKKIYLIDISRERGDTSSLVSAMRLALSRASYDEVQWIVRPNQVGFLRGEQIEMVPDWFDDEALVAAVSNTLIRQSATCKAAVLVSYCGKVLREVPIRVQSHGIMCGSTLMSQMVGVRTAKSEPGIPVATTAPPEFAYDTALKALSKGLHDSEARPLRVTDLRPRMIAMDPRCEKMPGEAPHYITTIMKRLTDEGWVVPIPVGTNVGYYLTQDGKARAEQSAHVAPNLPSQMPETQVPPKADMSQGFFENNGRGFVPSPIDASKGAGSKPQRVAEFFEILNQKRINCPPAFRDAFMGALQNVVAQRGKDTLPSPAEDVIQEAASQVPYERLGEPSEGQIIGYTAGMRRLLVQAQVLLDSKGHPIKCVHIMPAVPVAKLRDQAADWLIATLLLEILRHGGSLDGGDSDALLWVLFGRKDETAEERREHMKCLARAYHLLLTEELIESDDDGRVRLRKAVSVLPQLNRAVTSA